MLSSAVRSLAASQAVLAPPLRLAVVGSGPSGFYAASRVLQSFDPSHGTGDNGVEVHMLERLPTPYGLVRYGVAPDHPEVKNVEHKFNEVAQDPRFQFFGNLCVTAASRRTKSASSLVSEVCVSELAPYYTHILFAYGASDSRPLGIPGSMPKELRNVFHALRFVEWYNGHPDAHDPAQQDEFSLHRVDGDQIRRVAIVGAGNVALDVARVLLRQCAAAPQDETLAHTDVPEPVLQALRTWKVEELNLYVRRGAAQLAFTNKELREMLGLPHVPFRPVPPEQLDPAIRHISTLKEPGQKRAMTRLLGQLKKGSKMPYVQNEQHVPRWGLHLLRSPAALHGDSGCSPALQTVDWNVTEMDEMYRAVSKGKKVSSKEDLLIASVGYRSAPLESDEESQMTVPFDSSRFVIPNIRNRVVDHQGNVQPGMFVSGWLATGPVGVIVSTMFDAFGVADEMVKEWRSSVSAGENAKFFCTEAGFPEALREVPEAIRQQRTVSYNQWVEIDRAEVKRGKALEKPREKFLTVAEMLHVID
ncbi:adrenodoxin-NADP(+) reductase [Malassezia yamatoensis]|uniref:NADPH:adrenodoxin oxidoreductase, mitochondrial n=1 Tax=Malassezia yamatoensis TaxID=253288 RepID=A0AAJ5YQZ3_9BASI|nr:adrenodoxin-NADP(+) reductase [Malassezia yamatoensis]